MKKCLCTQFDKLSEKTNNDRILLCSECTGKHNDLLSGFINFARINEFKKCDCLMLCDINGLQRFNENDELFITCQPCKDNYEETLRRDHDGNCYCQNCEEKKIDDAFQEMFDCSSKYEGSSFGPLSNGLAIIPLDLPDTPLFALTEQIAECIINEKINIE